MTMFPLLLFFCLSALAAPVAGSYDVEALMGFKAAISLDPNNSLLDWSVDHTLCNWTAIKCSPRQERVVSLNLTGKGLIGSISPLVGNLSFLRVLDLSYNSLQGHIPYQLGKLFRLRSLRLTGNHLEGHIPSSLGSCRSLQYLLMAYNNLSGSIPSDLSLLSKLEIMSIAANNLTGGIPPILVNMSALAAIDLSQNTLEGNIPVELGMLRKLKWLNLHMNSFLGPIPVALSNCTHLESLDLSQNHLNGPIPVELGRLSELQTVILGGNQLTGEIPTSVSNWTQLQWLYLNDNLLSGTIPLEFGKMQQLTRFSLWQNQFVSGDNGLSIITVLTNCSSLEVLQLASNYLTGVLPASIGCLSNSLSDLTLGSNEIEGNIPGEIGNLTSLATLSLEASRFNGIIPSALSKLSNLERLFLEANNLHGRIPESFGQLKRLGLLALSENMLSGKIPDSLGELPQLRRLILHHNQLSGKIPASLGRCKTLELVDLAHNKLIGNIPLEVAGLQNLQFYFNVSGNLLQGSIMELSKMEMVLAIDVSQNTLSGDIPSVLASCKELEYLNLSSNAFEGPIPTSLGDLQNLQSMDLSCNNLSGTIPIAFKKMKMLQHLNLSSNRLTGEVPKEGAFATLDTSEISGNHGLCGDWLNLPTCSNSSHKQSSIFIIVIIPVAFITAILTMFLVLVAFPYRRTHSSTLSLNLWPHKISYEELVIATGGFSMENILGIGSFGPVYKGILKNGTNIAVKVFQLEDEHAHQSFSRECNALKRIRHRNVIKIISVCSTLDFKALIFPFMSNGSLDRWLYPPKGGTCILSLSDRLRIAMELAEGMAYLHHYSFTQVIHCDLKPKNVLLGDDMTSYIADFGLSNLSFDNSLDSFTSTNAHKGSIGYIAPAIDFSLMHYPFHMFSFFYYTTSNDSNVLGVMDPFLFVIIEYGIGGKLSAKGDVYSYGILILELITRRRPTDDMLTKGINLQKWTKRYFPNRILDVVDNSLFKDDHESGTSRVMECLTQFIQLGLLCTRESPQGRPHMTEIVDRLNTIRATFLGTTKSFQLPINISSFIDDGRKINMSNLGNIGSCSTSTS